MCSYTLLLEFAALAHEFRSERCDRLGPRCVCADVLAAQARVVARLASRHRAHADAAAVSLSTLTAAGNGHTPSVSDDSTRSFNPSSSTDAVSVICPR